MYYLNNKPPFACIKQKSRIEPELLPISAYYIALTTKYSHIVRTLLEDPVDANTFQLVFIYLSKDLMNIRQKSEYDVDLYLTFGDYISGKNIDIEGTFKFVKRTHHDFVIDLADFYINNLITKRYINDLFEEGSHFLSPNEKGKCKLKDNYPDIIDYLEIAL